MNQEMDLLYCSLARSWAKVEPLIQIKHGLRFFFFFFLGSLNHLLLRAQILNYPNKIIFINEINVLINKIILFNKAKNRLGID